jgi:type II secretory pathway pseudopilin PulG
MVIIGILSTFAFSSLAGATDATRLARATAEFRTMRNAIQVYRIYNDSYPSDVDRDIPPGIEPYLSSSDADNWPVAPWPGSVYDYDAFVSGGVPTYQISIRFCEIGDPASCNFPDLDWAADFDVNSSAYWCIEGNCKAHPSQPADHPGYCVNCGEEE